MVEIPSHMLSTAFVAYQRNTFICPMASLSFFSFLCLFFFFFYLSIGDFFLHRISQGFLGAIEMPSSWYLLADSGIRPKILWIRPTSRYMQLTYTVSPTIVYLKKTHVNASG